MKLLKLIPLLLAVSLQSQAAEYACPVASENQFDGVIPIYNDELAVCLPLLYDSGEPITEGITFHAVAKGKAWRVDAQAGELIVVKMVGVDRTATQVALHACIADTIICEVVIIDAMFRGEAAMVGVKQPIITY